MRSGYARGGEPVYVCDYSGTNRLPQHDTISIVDENSRRLHSFGGVRKLGCYSYKLFEARASVGAVFRADEIERAKAFITENRNQLLEEPDAIEVADYKTIRTNPIDLHVDVEVRRLKASLRGMALNEAGNDKELTSIISLLDHLAAQDIITREAGAAAIEAYIAWCERKQIAYTSEHNYSFDCAKEAIKGINSHCTRRGVTRTFDEDDDGALASLAT